MCDINKISKETESMIQDINATICASGAVVVQVQKEMKEIEKKAEENIRKLSFLL